MFRTRAPLTASILALLVGLVTATTAPAQSFPVGIKGGLNLTDLVGNDAGDTGSAVGLNAGGSFQFLSIGPVSIGPEIYYAQKKSDRESVMLPGGGTATGTTSFNLAYVEAPVLASVRLGRFAGNRLAPYIQAGPVFGWNLDCDIDVTDQAAASETCQSLLGGDVESTLKDYEQGVTFGAGLNVVVVPGRGALNLDLRSTHGLSDVVETETGPDLEIRNRAFTAMLGYSFAF